jgi:6-phosphofructokinase 1
VTLPTKWKIESASLKNIANIEKNMPRKFISKSGFEITSAGKKYLRPLIQGQAPTKLCEWHSRCSCTKKGFS